MGDAALAKNLGTVQSKESEGRLCVNTLVRGRPVLALVDTGADTTYMAKEIADDIGLEYEKTEGYVKGVNARRS